MTPEELGRRMVNATDIYGGNTVEEGRENFYPILKLEATGRRMPSYWQCGDGVASTGRMRGKRRNMPLLTAWRRRAYEALEKLISLQ